MRIKLFVLFFISHLIGLTQSKVEITINNFNESEVIIGNHFGTQRLIYDTISVNQSKIVIESDSIIPKGLYFIYSPSLYVEFVLAESNFYLEFDASTYRSTGFTTNSLENQIFTDFQTNMSKWQPKQRELAQSLDSLSGSDSLNVRNELIEITSTINNYQDSIIDTYSDSFFAGFVSLMRGKQTPDFKNIEDEKERNNQKYLWLKEHYFDDINLVEMMRTPVVDQYVNKYFNELIIPQPDSINKAIDKLFDMVNEDDQAFRYWLVTFFNKYQESNLMGMDAVTAHLVENYYLSPRVDWITEESRAEMVKELQFIKPNLIGKPAPFLNLVDTSGSNWTLREHNSDYIILYFYDPDCGVCKKKTPVLYADYELIKNEGGEVAGICTTTDQSRWKEYIKNNDLNWINLADPNFKSNFRASYNVRSTPQVYILDRNKKIIAKKLDVSQVLSFIKDHKRVSAANDF
jgi:peroxiredoxin